MEVNADEIVIKIEEGRFSGHLITKQRIKTDPSKVKAISDLQPPKSGEDKTLLFMRTLKNCTSGKMVQWTTKAEEAFRRIKELLETLPTVTALVNDKTLIVYIAASEESIKTSPEDNRKKVGRKMDAKLEETKPSHEWKLYTDGAFSSDGSGGGLMLLGPKAKEYAYALRLEFEITNNEAELYKKSFYTPWLRCIALPKTDDVIKDIHGGSCGFNMEPRSMVARMTKQGYYWPSMHRDVARIIQDCNKCKEQSAATKRAEIGAIAAGNAWPFSHWGVRILDPYQWPHED
nr:reverse transcriptase domain-containing protein [Tanacetum cinerariifolium]